MAELLRLQYDDYTQVLGPAYHAFKTSDHVSRYRRDIVARLQGWQLDEDWLSATADELATQDNPDNLAALCLAGNPSPSCRHLLSRLAATLPAATPLHVWADIDYGGLNILAQLRRHVSPRFAPYRMDVETLDAFARWGQPLTSNDARNLRRLRDHPALVDMTPLIDEMLLHEVKSSRKPSLTGQ